MGKGHRLVIKLGDGGPPKTPPTELEIIHRRTLSGPAFYHTVRKPGCDTIGGLTSIPRTPNLFKGLRANTSRELTIGDMPDYGGKNAELTLEIPESDIQERFSSDGGIVTAVQILHTPAGSPTSIISVPFSTDVRPPSTRSEGSYVEENELIEPMGWVFGDNLGEVSTPEHVFITDEGVQTLQRNCQRLYDEFLEFRNHTTNIGDQIDEFIIRSQYLEASVALAKKRSERLTRRKKKLIMRGRDTYIAYIQQYVERLIELREFIGRMDEGELQDEKQLVISEWLATPGFEFVVRNPRRKGLEGTWSETNESC